MRRIFAKKQEEDTASALTAWSMLVRQRKAAGTRVRGKLRQLLMGSLVLGFEGWAQGVRACKQERMRESKAGRIMRMWAWGFAVDAWAAWSGYCAALRVQKKKLASVVMRLGPGAVAGRVLNTWRERVRERRVMKRVMLKILLKQVATAFETWSSNVAEGKRHHAIIGRVVARILNRSLSGAFLMWADNVEESRRQAGVMGRVMGRLMNRCISMALETWVENAREIKRQRGVVARVAARMMGRCTALALGRWMENVAEMKRTKGVLHRVAMRFACRGQAMALDLWKGNVVEIKRQRAIMAKVVLRINRAGLVQVKLPFHFFNAKYSLVSNAMPSWFTGL
jgi:hypothetical protein